MFIIITVVIILVLTLTTPLLPLHTPHTPFTPPTSARILFLFSVILIFEHLYLNARPIIHCENYDFNIL